MIKVQISTGLAWLQEFTVNCNIDEDCDQGITDYVMEHKEEFSTMTYDEIVECYGPNTEDIENALNDFHHPINGGEYYIGAIQWIGEL